MEAPLLVIIGTAFIAIARLVRPRGGRAGESADAATSTQSHVLHSALVVVSALTAVIVAALLFATVGQSRAKAYASGMRAAAAEGPEDIVTLDRGR